MDKHKIFAFLFIFLYFILQIASCKDLVISSDQDAEIAEFFAEEINASLVVIRWGSCEEFDLSDVKRAIIIGGEVAVPKCVEDFLKEKNVTYERIGGKRRENTAKLVLKKLNIEVPEEDILGNLSKQEGGAYFIGRGCVAERWANFLKNELIEGNSSVFIGNFLNNEELAKEWCLNYPTKVSLLPLVIRCDNKLFFTGTDNLLPISIMKFEKIKKKCHSKLFFLVFIFYFLAILASHFLTRNIAFISLLALLLSIFIIKFYLLLENFDVNWDCYVGYLDGALSLYYQNTYDPIFREKYFPGTSIVVALWFMLTKPSTYSLYLLNLSAALLLITFLCLLAFSITKNPFISILPGILLLTDDIFERTVLFFGSDIIFLFFFLSSLFLLYKNTKLWILSSIFSTAVRFSGIILPISYAAVRRDIKPLLIVSFFSLLFLYSFGITGYVREYHSKSLMLNFEFFSENFRLYANAIHPVFLILFVVSLFFLKEKIVGYTAILCFVAAAAWCSREPRYILPAIPLIYLQVTILVYEVYKKFKMENPANAITISRTILIFVAVTLLYFGNETVKLVGAFAIILSFVLDAVDGLVARKFKLQTVTGSLLDVLGDRITEYVLWIFFLDADLIPLWASLIVITRGVLTDFIRAEAEAKNIAVYDLPKSRVAKFLVASRIMRFSIGFSKMILFSLLSFKMAGFDISYSICYTLIIITVALNILRGLPVIIERLKYRP